MTTLHVFDLEHTLFETGCFMLFIGSLCLALCMGILQSRTRSISVKSRTPFLWSAVAFFGINAFASIIYRQFLQVNLLSEWAVFVLGISAVLFAWFSVPFVIDQWGIALNSLYRKKIEDVLNRYVSK